MTHNNDSRYWHRHIAFHQATVIMNNTDYHHTYITYESNIQWFKYWSHVRITQRDEVIILINRDTIANNEHTLADTYFTHEYHTSIMKCNEQCQCLIPPIFHATITYKTLSMSHLPLCINNGMAVNTSITMSMHINTIVNM